MINKDILEYNITKAKDYREICDLLAQEINKNLPRAESKLWHGSPVWFIDSNPIVGYHKLKDCVRLLFWSGQSFVEKGLIPEGSFKAAEKRYVDIDEVKKSDLKRRIKDAKSIQWDYKNIVKRRGKLQRVK